MMKKRLLLESEDDETTGLRSWLMEGGVPIFLEDLDNFFGPGGSDEILGKLKQLDIPRPVMDDEYLVGTEGILLFLSECAVVVRIEAVDGETLRKLSLDQRDCFLKDNNKVNTSEYLARIDDSPWVLRPLGSVGGKNFRIEIVPGVHFEDSARLNRRVYRGMLAEGNHYWDSRPDNIGRLPFPTPEFPSGMPVVVDRLAVERLTGSIEPVRTALCEMKLRLESTGYDLANIFRRAAFFARKVADFALVRMIPPPAVPDDPQLILYKDLQDAFQEACPKDGDGMIDSRKMECFWKKVKQAKSEGRLVAGWDENIPDNHTGSGLHHKQAAQKAAQAYLQRRRFCSL